MTCRALWYGAALLFLSLSAVADEVRLANGDRISGEVKGKTRSRLIVDTPYAGELSIRWSEVQSLVTSRPIEMLLEGESKPLRGTLQPLYGGGALLVDADGEGREVALRDIAMLNPKPYESGRGVDYAGRALLSAAYARGNVDSDHVHAEAELTARAREYRYSLSGRFDRRTEPLVDTNTAWLLGANYDRFLAQRQFAYVRGSLEHDRAKDIDRRSALGAGYGLQLVETAAANVSVRGGLDYVAVERFAGERESYPAFGWGLKAAYSPWGPRLQLFHEQDGFWNLEDTDVVVLRSKTGLRVPLVDGLNATAQLNVDWEKRPAPGRESTDSTLLFGVDYAF